MPQTPARALRSLRAVTVALSVACASTPPFDEELPSAEGYYTEALEVLEGRTLFLFFDDVDYSRAIELLQEVMDNYPYSEYANLAELKIADIYYDQERWEEAASAYQDFVELHPTNANAAYAIYRTGLCSLRLMGAPDQDQTATRDAIEQFQALIERYPEGEYSELARERLGEARDELSMHDVMVGDFYYDRGDYYAAQKRYRTALAADPRQRQRLETMYRLGASLRRVGSFHEAEDLLLQVLADAPHDDLRDRVEEELYQLGVELQPDDPYHLPRSCVTHPNPSCPPPASLADE